MGYSSSSKYSIWRIFCAIASFLCIGLLVSLALESGGGGKALPPPLSSQGLSTMAARPNNQLKLDPLHEIKRRVPNGPDPIHNRKAGKFDKPAGRM